MVKSVGISTVKGQLEFQRTEKELDDEWQASWRKSGGTVIS